MSCLSGIRMTIMTFWAPEYSVRMRRGFGGIIEMRCLGSAIR